MEATENEDGDYRLMKAVQVKGEWLTLRKTTRLMVMESDAIPQIEEEMIVLPLADGRTIAVRGRHIEAVELDL